MRAIAAVLGVSRSNLIERRHRRYGSYEGIVILGHGSPDGRIEAAPGIPMTWEAVGRAVEALTPRAILAVSCYGGGARPTRALFDAIPSLDAVMGSPSPLTADQAWLATLELLWRIYGLDTSPELSALATMLNAALTGGIVWTRTRAEFMGRTDADLQAEDAFASLAETLVRIAGHDPRSPRRFRRPRRLTHAVSRSRIVRPVSSGAALT